MTYTKDWQTLSLQELATELKQAKETRDADKEKATESQKFYDFLSKEVIPARMEEEGVTNITLQGIGRLQKTTGIQTHVSAADRQSLYEWLDSHGFGDLISETIFPGTLKAWVKERMTQGEEYPSDLISVHAYERASVVKG